MNRRQEGIVVGDDGWVPLGSLGITNLEVWWCCPEGSSIGGGLCDCDVGWWLNLWEMGIGVWDGKVVELAEKRLR
jgi:hypothetical protein